MTKEQTSTVASLPFGPQQIVVLDRGWVFVGKSTVTDDWITIENARCIRYWGTTTGLGQLIDGPTDKTKLDPVGTIIAPRAALKFFIACKREW